MKDLSRRELLGSGSVLPYCVPLAAVKRGNPPKQRAGARSRRSPPRPVLAGLSLRPQQDLSSRVCYCACLGSEVPNHSMNSMNRRDWSGAGWGGSKMRALAVILAVGCACWAPTALLAAPGAAKPPMGYSNCAR